VAAADHATESRPAVGEARGFGGCGVMNTIIFVVYVKRRAWYVALCACGVPHGRYPAVALIPPGCPGCEQQAIAKQRKVS
jgi:hypothetical protein